MSQQITEDLRRLCSAAGTAGHTDIVQEITALLSPLMDSVQTDALGNVLGIRRCENEAAPTILLEAHLDEIGFLVTHIDDKGFIHVAAAGSPDERVLAAQPVIVYGDRPYPGVFCSVPPHLAKDDSLPELPERGIDIGMSAEDARRCVPLGSRVGFAPNFVALNDRLVSSKALDDRAGIAAILHCLRQLQQPLSVHIAVAFCVQEELGCRGCVPAVRQLHPDEALITDVSFAYTPDANIYQCGALGGGVMIGISPILHRGMGERLFALAEAQGVPHQTEVMAGTTGTDADMISKAEQGIPCALLSIPQRFMHTPVEVVDVRDVAAVGDLMAAYIRTGGVQS